MAYKPTPSQSLAIDAKNKTLLISAAAGAGKTSTLTQRIIKSITEENADISRILVVTYTRASAADLRRKINEAIAEALVDDPTNPHLNEQALLVGSADICTIDSFCLDVVKSNFQRLKSENDLPALPPDFRIADTTELAALSISVMNALIDEWYDDPPSDGINFAAFAENFEGLRDDGNLTKNLIKFSDSTASYKNGASFALDSARNLFAAAESNEFFDSAPGRIIAEQTREALLHYANVLDDAIDYLTGIPTADKNYIPAFRDDLNTVNSALAALDLGYAQTKEALCLYSPQGLTKLGKYADELTAAYKMHRDEIKSGLLSLRKQYYSFPPDLLADYMKATAEKAQTLGAFVDEYRARFAREKALRKICDFRDIQRHAHKLLVIPGDPPRPSDIALALREKYTDVYIDEYQDVDSIQDEIFATVAPPNRRFMVGDIKQSIYGFRGSDPSIFGKYRRNFPPLGSDKSAEGYSIFMSDNFRCNEPIINFSNLVSRATFAVAGEDINYQSEDDLVHGKRESVSSPVKVAIFKNPKRNSGMQFKTKSAEVRYVVSEISKLLNAPPPGRDTPLKPEDIAVLVRSAKIGAKVAEGLALANIAVSDSSSKDYFSNPEVLFILSVLGAIDNPHNDVRLASALRSPAFDFSMEDLVKIRRAGDRYGSLFDSVDSYSGENDELAERCKSFKEVLASLRHDARALPLDRFVRKIFDKFSFTSLELPNDIRSSVQIRDNILRFYEYARSFASQRNGGDLSSFVKYIDDVMAAKTKTDKGNGRAPGKVSIMTVHGSKGLEFPAVFFVGCGDEFNREDLEDSLVYDQNSGIAMQIADKTGYTRVDTPIRAAVSKSIINRSAEEEMRILYVALTRASELLYVTATAPKDKLEKLQNDVFIQKYLCKHTALSAICFFDWLMPVAALKDPSFELSVFAAEDVLDVDSKDTESGEEKKEDNRENIDLLKKAFSKKFEQKYVHEATVSIPAKLSVSKLKPDMLENDGASTLEDTEQKGETASLSKLHTKPLFMLEGDEKTTKATAAERGTATHAFLQFCNFENAERDLEAELARLTVIEHFMPEAAADLVNKKQLRRFFASDLYRSVKNAVRYYREQRFNVFLPASDFAKDSALHIYADERLHVQGVIDIVFEDKNGDIILCDYKTDYLTEEQLSDKEKAKEELTKRYKNQLYYYKRAVTLLFEKEPSRVCIYSLPLGDTVDIDV